MSRDNFLKFIQNERPEIYANLHLPIFCIVAESPPNISGSSTRELPKHCVSVNVLKNDLTIDINIPTLNDVPVALPFAGNGRGLCALPQLGTMCELCFAYGSPTLPYIRSILPYHLTLPDISDHSIKLQFSPTSFIELEDQCIKQKNANIYLTVENEIKSNAKEILEYAEKIHIGTNNDNFLKIVSDFMQSCATAFASLATHTHPYVNVAAPAITSQNQQDAALNAEQSKINSLKGTLDQFTK